MGRVTRSQRQHAREQAADTTRFAKAGTVAAAKLFASVRVFALSALSTNRDPLKTLDDAFRGIRPVLRAAMLASRLTGARRIRRLAPVPIAAANDDVFERATNHLGRLLRLSDSDLARIEAQFDTEVLRVTDEAHRFAEARIRQAINDTIAKGLHVREAKTRLAEAFRNAGIVPENSFTLEAIFRTQTMLAYGAGKANVESEPAIQEILWGYKYVTVGDSRVRPSHAAMDGVTLPAKHAFWETNYPPNGWACRCQAIPLFEAEEVVPPAEAGKGGEIGRADEGFRFRPDRLFGAL